MTKCDEDGHYWQFAEKWEKGVKDEMEGISIPVECENCGMKAREYYVYSCRLDEKGKEVE